MPDVVGYRSKMGVIIPSTNTVVEHDYSLMRPPGVTFHFGRMYIAQPNAADNEAFEELIAQIRVTTEIAVRDVMTAKPDHLVMGMSAETFWGGKEGNEAFAARVGQLSGGLSVTTGAAACGEATRSLGITKIAVITPYQPVADEQARNYFTEIGLDVVRVVGLKCSSATAIAEVDEAQIRRTLKEIDGSDIEGIVQVGTNLSMLRLADEAERWLNKPVLAINAVTVWHALRSCGFTDRMQGFGTLLREY